MKLYDSIIYQTLEILQSAESVSLPDAGDRKWKDTGESELIWQKDAAFELGGGGNPSVNYTCVTTSGIIPCDEILCCGPDLPQIRKMAFEDLDECMYLVLKSTVTYLGDDPSNVDPISLRAYDYYRTMHFAGIRKT